DHNAILVPGSFQGRSAVQFPGPGELSPLIESAGVDPGLERGPIHEDVSVGGLALTPGARRPGAGQSQFWHQLEQPGYHRPFPDPTWAGNDHDHGRGELAGGTGCSKRGSAVELFEQPLSLLVPQTMEATCLTDPDLSH